MKKLYLLAAAALTLAACTDEAYLGENKEFTNTDNPIGFNMSTPAMSRADITGKEAAKKLDNAFFVYGIKDETTIGAGKILPTGETNVHNVMNNYVVTYAENSAMTTTSNTEGWEYVGNTLTTEQKTNVTPNAGTEAQTIKYWDWGAKDYTFTAITASQYNIKKGFVTIAKINDSSTGKDAYDQGYTLTISDKAGFDSIFIADRVYIERSNNTDRTEHNVYGGQVNFKFRSLGTKVRAGMYETVPGYTVTVDKMYGNSSDVSTTNFMASCPNTTIAEGKSITATVTYNDGETTVKNQPTVAFTGATDALLANNTLKLGTNVFTTGDPATAVTLSSSSAAPTYDTDGGGYTFVLPQEDNDKDMTVKLDYTLTCTATGEKIYVKGASAVVPAQYLKWKPNFSYTYMFKISDNTNGHTDPAAGPAGLYPITFDAVVVDAGDGIAEYITTVSDPSITTFGVKGGKYVTDASAYAAGTDIYATVMAGETPAVQTLTLGSATAFVAGNVNLLKITKPETTDASYITEAAVAEYFAENYEKKMGTTTPKLTADVDNTNAEVVSTVPGEDGVDITSTSALHVMNTLAAGWYAVQYIQTDAVEKVVAVYDSGSVLTSGTTLTDYYTKDGDVYTKCAAGATADGTTTYYLQTTAPVAPVAPKAQYKVFEIK